jgi:hypothetical protein
MVDLVDGLVGGNLTEQGVAGRKTAGRTDSSVGFQSVLNDVATESPLDSSQSNSRPTELRHDIASGNELPDADHNLPSASDEDSSQIGFLGERAAAGENSDAGISIAVAEDGGLTVPQQASIQPSLTGELGELIRLIESDGNLDSSLLGAATRLIGTDSALDSSLPGVSTRLAGSDRVLDSSVPLIPLGASGHGASLVNGVAVESGAKPMAASAQLAGDITAAAQLKLTPNALSPEFTGSRVMAGAELDVSFENETILELNRQLLTPQRGANARLDTVTAVNQSASGTAPTIASVSLSSPSAIIDGMARGAPVLTTADPEGFSASIATHLRVMKSGGVSEARLQLNPAELGRLSIQIASQDSEVKVSFVVESQQAKQVIENAMPRLRDLLDGAGLDLTESGVDQRDKHADDRNPQHGRQVADSDHFSDDSAQIAMTVTVDPDRLVDAYA